MNLLVILPHYIVWHYGRALADMVIIWKNFLYFVYNFFSIKTLIMTMFSPWRRMGDEYREHGSLEDVMGTFVVNVVMRCLGAVIRLIYVIVGIILLLITICFGFVLFVIWLILPVILVYLISLSINFILK